VTASSIASSNFTVGAGSTLTLPTLQVGAATRTIGSVTVNAGAASVVTQSIGATTTPASIGAITGQGAGRVDVTVNPTAAATVASGASAQGTISGAAMTSPLSSFRVTGTNAVAQLSVVGGSGNDSLVGGTAADFITGGVGADTLTGNAGQDVFIFSVGDSNPVYSGGQANSTGQDTITANGTNTTEQLLRFNITSVDTTWAMDHILVGTAANNIIAVAGTNTAGNTDGFAATTVLVQAGTATAAGTANTDAFDIVINMGTALTAAEAQAISQINLTGTAGADTLTTGANNDTINGGAGADTITGGAGADIINVGSSTTDVDRVVQAAAGDSGTFAAPGTNTIATTTFDVISGMSAADVLRLAQYTSFGTAANNVAASTLGTVATTLVNLTVGANSIGFVRGTYTAPVVSNGVVTTAGSFVGSATGSDLMVVYDGDASLATTALEAVVLVGAGANTVTASGAGLLTLGGG
jgi:Ca2+-binding RTX toxin-like protein